jgi:Lysozyme inhibitor LprI
MNTPKILMTMFFSCSMIAGCDKKIEVVAKSPEVADKTCSSQLAVQTISDIFADNVEREAREENKSIPEEKRLDLAKIRAVAGQIKYSLDDVLTTKTDPHSTKKFCEASLSLAIPGNTLTNANEKRKTQNQPQIKTLAEDSNFRVDGDKYSLKISYSVQPTDDGKKLQVTVDNVKPFQQIVSATVIWAAVNLPTQNTSSGSLQQAIASPAPPAVSPPAAANGSGGASAPLVATTEQTPKSPLTMANEDYAAAEHEINFVWKSLPKQIRDANLDAQKVFNTEKETVCAKEALAAGDGEKFEIARNKCWTRFYKARTPELKRLMGSAVIAPLLFG